MSLNSVPIAADPAHGDVLSPPRFPESIIGLETAIKTAELSPRVYKAVLGVCLATRAAWVNFHSDWSFLGELAADQIKRFEQALASAEQIAVSASHELGDAKDKKFAGQFARNIKTRAQLVELLVTAGPAAVRKRINELQAERAQKRLERQPLS